MRLDDQRNEEFAIMASDWFIRINNAEHGPFTSERLKQLALEGKVKPDTLVKNGQVGTWHRASDVRGLIAEPRGQSTPVKAKPPTRVEGKDDEVLAYLQAAEPPSPSPVVTSAPATKACPFCGETILFVAKKCKHCGEFLDHGSVAAPSMPTVPFAIGPSPKSGSSASTAIPEPQPVAPPTVPQNAASSPASQPPDTREPHLPSARSSTSSSSGEADSGSSSSATERWYVCDNDKTFGPYSEAELKEMLVEGTISPAAQVKDGEHGSVTPIAFRKARSRQAAATAKPHEDSGDKKAKGGFLAAWSKGDEQAERSQAMRQLVKGCLLTVMLVALAWCAWWLFAPVGYVIHMKGTVNQYLDHVHIPLAWTYAKKFAHRFPTRKEAEGIVSELQKFDIISEAQMSGNLELVVEPISEYSLFFVGESEPADSKPSEDSNLTPIQKALKDGVGLCCPMAVIILVIFPILLILKASRKK